MPKHKDLKTNIRWLILYQSKGWSDEQIRKELGYKKVGSISRLRSYPFFHSESERIKDKLDQPVGLKNKSATPEELTQIKTLLDQGMTIKEIAAETGIKYTRVVNIMYGHGMKSKTRRKITDDDKLQILRLIKEGKTGIEISEITGFSEQSVSRIKKRYGFKKYKALSESDKFRIRRMYHAGISGNEISRRIGRTQSAVSKYIRHLYIREYYQRNKERIKESNAT